MSTQKHPVKTTKAETTVVTKTEPAAQKKEAAQPEPTPAPEQHVPGQVEEIPPQPQVVKEVAAEGNNIASVEDRAFADTLPANSQPPVEKTFVSPKD